MRKAPVSRRDRPAKPPLSRDGVIAVALRIMQEEGLEKLTMRRVAAELDTGPASLYVYVSNMAELHGALLDELLTYLSDMPGSWSDRVVDLLGQYHLILTKYPGLARSVLLLRPAGPRYVRLIDTLLGLLHEGGVPPAQAAWGVDLLLQMATASAAEHAGDDQSDQQQVEAVRDADPLDYPNVSRVRDELFAGTGEQRQRWAFTALLKGIATTPRGS
ncbi:TetR/AcrR family transcriptional regulator [Actinoplanes sp. KI2]|uniref:TetR/AcrR family transcriptional regulator n=1 Tax=Actinoplanes sp. KI2 TaxID=2983315 RepID=UPI0021D59BF9|nr:TetR/AcrR family transcriptional regulator [Actinoplanes sp. KI2]MCU7726940.1 TetR/AcrR family transcriptional regulator [Actinoplanes sp. KI2]